MQFVSRTIPTYNAYSLFALNIFSVFIFMPDLACYRPFSEADFPDFLPFGDQVVSDVRVDCSRCFLLQPTVLEPRLYLYIMYIMYTQRSEFFSTAGLAIRNGHAKIQFAARPRGLRRIRNYVQKALDEENPTVRRPKTWITAQLDAPRRKR